MIARRMIVPPATADTEMASCCCFSVKLNDGLVALEDTIVADVVYVIVDVAIRVTVETSIVLFKANELAISVSAVDVPDGVSGRLLALPFTSAEKVMLGSRDAVGCEDREGATVAS